MIKLLFLPIATLIITSYLLSKIPNEPKPIKKSVQVQQLPRSADTTEEKKLPTTPNVHTWSNTGKFISNYRDIESLVKERAIQFFGEEHWEALQILIMKESSWNHQAINKSSGACGLFQALPCEKMGGMELENQINWGLNYIRQRYKNPTNALAFHYQHNWY